MSCALNRTERLTIQDVKNKEYILHNVCKWHNLNKPAIEYHDLEEIKIISYDELRTAKGIISDHLKCIQYPEFIGINLDIFGYCVPSLMLGILDSGNAFFNVPSDSLIYKEIFRSLHVKYIFTRYVASNRKIICKFNIHGQVIYLTKLINVQESIVNSRKWYHFAYAIATSGSTGIPKVVQVLHSCILPNITDLRRILDVTERDKIAQLTNFTFDPSIVEIFLTVSCAATLFTVSKSLKNEADRFLEKISHAHVTILQITPSLFFHTWSTKRLKATILDKDSNLRVLLFGGEPFPSMRLFLEASHPQNMTRLFNIYGITEVSCWSSVNEVIKNCDNESCLGEFLSETVFQIRNEDDEIITRGEGILHIGSSTRICIIGDETERNLNKPVFRNTGDIVSVDDHGRIYYRGRQNNIIKRFGNKVNLRELEKVVTELSFIRNCAALWDSESHKLYLCLSTIKTKEEFSNLQNDVISYLRILPAIYKPDKIIVVEQFDFTTSGKICLGSLRDLCRKLKTEIISVNNLNINVDKIFENLWTQHIKSKDAGFLASGGTSITALQISSSTAEVFKMEFPELISMLLKDFTLDKCVNYIKSILTSRDLNKNLNRRIDTFLDDKFSKKIFNIQEEVTRESSSNNSSISTNQTNCYRWYKCRGKTYGDASTQEQNSTVPLINTPSIEILANYNLQKCVDASPTIYCYSETELYAVVGSHSGIICNVNLLESDKSYEIKLPDRIEASILVLTNFRGIVGCYDGYIYCIHLKTGEIIWKYQTQDMVKCTAITCAQGSKIFVGSYDHYVYCLSIEDGSQIWKIKASQGSICATGCLHPQSTSVLFGTLDNSCLALQQFSGQVTWRRKLRDPIFVAPVALRDGHALFCSVAGTLCCFDIEMDCQMWCYEIHGNIFSYPVLRTRESTNSEYIILASHNKNLYYLEMPRRIMEKNEPRLRYTLQLHSPIFATPWCTEGSEDGCMFVACVDGTFQILNLSDGKLLTSMRLPGETFSSPIVHKDLVLLGCRDNNLYVLKLS